MTRIYSLSIASFYFVLWVPWVAHAQNDTTGVGPDSLDRPSAKIVLMTRADEDSVVLRWGPDTPGGWVKTRQVGYHIERAKVDTLTEFDSTAVEQLTDTPIKPWSLEEWKQRISENDDFALMAAEALYGERFTVEPLQSGNPIEAMRNAADELQNRFGFALYAADNSVTAAKGLGLRFVDRQVDEGATYIYTVSPAKFDSTYPIQPGTSVADIEPHETDLPPQDLQAEPGDGQIVLTWKELPDEAYSGYYIYRSSDGGETYDRLNEVPHVFMQNENIKPDLQNTQRFIDTSAVNYTKYRYRIRGINPFAELSPPAEVTAMARDQTPPPPAYPETPEQVGKNALRITWTYPDTVSGLEGFYISRGSYHEFESSDRLLEEPLPPTTRSYVISSATMDQPWYFVAAVDTAGNIMPSLGVYGELIDKEPPSVPTGLSGKIDTTGVVKLHWNLGPEDDIKGYRVLYANDPTHEYSAANSHIIRDTVYTDSTSLNTLTKAIYFKIAAVDLRHNQSGFSEILKLQRPDIVPPESSVFTNVFVTDSSVTLHWRASTSKDTKRQVLYRRKDSPEAQWDSLAGLSRTAQTYIDTAIVQNTRYRYRIQAVDSTGLRSKFASTVQARPYDTGVRPAPVLTSASYDSTQQKIILEWKYQPPEEEFYYFVLYRSLAGSTPTTYKALEADNRQYEDQALVSGSVYQYAIKVKTRNGGESRLSETLRVTIKE